MFEMKLVPYQVTSIHTEQTTKSYGVVQMECPEVWAASERGNGVVVAILDTGISQDHVFLSRSIIGGHNFTQEGTSHDFHDDNGHGTHVAGTILDVAPEAQLLICKVLGKAGGGTYHSIIKGLKWATHWRGANGERVRVINMSLGGSHNDPKLYQAILDACAEGILVCVASGNEGDSNESTYEFAYPALYNECITVAACDKFKKLAGFSNEHLQVDVIAAGVDIESTYLNGQYAILSGTSMATPHISGALALVINVGEKQFKRMLTESEIYALLVKCCCSLGYQKSSEGNGIPQLSQLEKHCVE
jgi:major intracellular serine protease